MRQACSKPLMDRLHAFLVDQQPLHLPKGPMGKAISYILGNWKELTRFLDDARLPPDNNRSEAALRIIALGRKNFLHVGHEEAGENIAVGSGTGGAGGAGRDGSGCWRSSPHSRHRRRWGKRPGVGIEDEGTGVGVTRTSRGTENA